MLLAQRAAVARARPGERQALASVLARLSQNQASERSAHGHETVDVCRDVRCNEASKTRAARVHQSSSTAWLDAMATHAEHAAFPCQLRRRQKHAHAPRSTRGATLLARAAAPSAHRKSISLSRPATRRAHTRCRGKRRRRIPGRDVRTLRRQNSVAVRSQPPVDALRDCRARSTANGQRSRLRAVTRWPLSTDQRAASDRTLKSPVHAPRGTQLRSRQTRVDGAGVCRL